MPVGYLLYQSVGTDECGTEMLDTIFAQSRQNNAAVGLTGFLHFEDGVFLQYLEGPEAQLSDCVSRISKDPRHYDVETISSGDAPKRYFPHWDMGALDSDATQLSEFWEIRNKKLILNREKDEDVLDLIVFLAARSEEQMQATH